MLASQVSPRVARRLQYLSAAPTHPSPPPIPTVPTPSPGPTRIPIPIPSPVPIPIPIPALEVVFGTRGIVAEQAAVVDV